MLQKPYDIVCCAAQVLGKPNPSWIDVQMVIKAMAGATRCQVPPDTVLRKAYDEFRRVPKSMAVNF